MKQKHVDGWAIVDGSGKLLIWSVTPTRFDTIKWRINHIGGQFGGSITEAQAEEFWRMHVSEAEDVVQVRITLLLN